MASKQKNEVGITNPTKSKINSTPRLVVNKAGESNFAEWDKDLFLIARQKYPVTFSEIYQEVPVETEEQKYIRLTQDMREIPLL